MTQTESHHLRAIKHLPTLAMSLCILWATALCESSVAADSISFRNDVMAVLSKSGCNQGACHGNANGKNGFKLSLRGEDPSWDFAALTHDTFGRRVNRLNPASSLILLKAT